MKWFYDMKIGSKLMAAFIIVAAITAVTGYIGIKSLGKISDLTTSLYENETVGSLHVKDARINLSEGVRAEKNIMLSTNSAEREKYQGDLKKYTASLSQDIEQTRPLIHSDLGKKILATLDEAWKERQIAATQTVALVLKEPFMEKHESMAFYSGVGRQKLHAVEDALIDLSADKEEAAKKAQQEAEQTYYKIRKLLFTLVVGGVLAGMGMGIFISRSISKPIGQLAETAKNISLGDVNQNVEYHSANEIG